MMGYLNVDLKPIFSIIVALSPIWLPIAIFYVAFEEWMWSVEDMFKYNSGRTTLRIKLPQEVFKSPEAMESVLTQMHNINSRDNLMQTYLDGKHPLVSSLELVSIGGDVRFYVNVPKLKVQNIIEAQLYAQYPGIEVIEEEVDYTAEVKWDPEKWDMISFHMNKRKEEIFPIKTYIDFGLDKNPKEEEKFDPISPMLEYLGTAKPHERVWIQFLLTPHDKLGFKEGKLVPEKSWTEAAEEEINRLMKRNEEGSGPEETESRPVLTSGERQKIEAIERNTAKYPYSVAIRAIYITETGKFDPDMISPLLRSFAQYDLADRNTIGVRWRTDYNYKLFQDFTGQRVIAAKRRELEYYKARYYLKEEKVSKVDEEKVFSVEEIATMYHIPSSTVMTPGLSRIESTRREAPSNLPVGEF